MTTAIETQYLFYRKDLGTPDNCPPSLISEREARTYIATCRRDVEKSIAAIKRGKKIQTRYAVFTAEAI